MTQSPPNPNVAPPPAPPMGETAPPAPAAHPVPPAPAAQPEPYTPPAAQYTGHPAMQAPDVGGPPPAAPAPPPTAEPAPVPYQGPIVDPSATPLTRNDVADIVRQTMSEVMQGAPAPAQSPQAAPAQAQPQPGPMNEEQLADLMFSDPVAFVREARAGIMQEFQQQVQAERQVEEMWGKFYQANPRFDRGRHHQVVLQMMNANFQQLQGLPQDQALQWIAHYTDQYLGQLGATPNGAGVQTVAAPTVGTPNAPTAVAPPIGEAPSPTRPMAPPPAAAPTSEASPQPKSLSAAIKARQAGRMNGNG